MSEQLHNARRAEVEVDSMFPDRWSPRAFLTDPVPVHQLQSLFEAARWAPSCNNEQPSVFIYATTPDDRERFASALLERNRLWAMRAPVLMFVLARRHFTRNRRPNRHAAFDTGAAWMSLALQARKLGLYAHAMAGFDQEKAYKVLGVTEEDYDVIAAIAVGRRGDTSQLPKELAQREQPNDRRPLSEVCFEARFTPQ